MEKNSFYSIISICKYIPGGGWMKVKELTKTIRKIVLISSFLIMIIGTSLLIGTIFKNKYEDKKEPLVSGKNSAIVNYQVNLLPNSIYDKKVLGEGNTYLTDYVENINTLLRYNFSSDKEVEIKGQYEVVALVEGFLSNDKDSKSLWSKQFILQPKSDFSFKGVDGEFKKEIPIDIKSYGEIIQQGNKALNMNFIGKLTVMWNVTVEGSSEYGNISEKLTPKMELPLNEKYFQITGTLSQDKNNTIEKTIKVISPKYKIYITVSTALITLGILCFLYILLFTKAKSRGNKAKLKIAKILKTYEDRFIALRDDALIGTELVVRVANIENLIRIADELDKPIFYKDSSNLEDIKAFYVIDHGRVYAYGVLSSESYSLSLSDTTQSI